MSGDTSSLGLGSPEMSPAKKIKLGELSILNIFSAISFKIFGLVIIHYIIKFQSEVNVLGD